MKKIIIINNLSPYSKKHMILFFINGSLKIEKYDYLPENNSIDFYEYKMRFLTETEEKTSIKRN